ncbi:MAG: tetratricopeptide repeat protein [Chloroflexota bacterium]
MKTGAVLIAALLFLILLIGGAVLLTPSGGMFTPRAIPTLSPQGHNVAIAENQRQNRPVQALYHVEALAARVGWTADLHRQAGDLWERVGDPAKALFHREQAALEQKDALLWRDLAEAYLASRDRGAAADSLEHIIEVEPQNAWANYHLGMLRAPFRPAEAEELLRQAALDPAYNQAARAVRVTLIEARADATIDEARLPMLVGLTMSEYELWPYAELAFDHASTLAEAISGEPYAEALAYRGLAQDRQGIDGSDSLIAAIQADPNNAQIRYLLALHFRYTENHDASVNAMVQAVQLEPENPALYAELGTAYRLSGDLEQAEEWLQAAVSFSNSDPEYLRLLALFYADEAINMGPDGVTALDDTLTLLPNDPDVLAGMGWAQFSMGNRQVGRAQVDQALEIDPNNPRALYYKARITLFDGVDPDLAVRLLEEVAATENDFTTEAQRLLATL